MYLRTVFPVRRPIPPAEAIRRGELEHTERRFFIREGKGNNQGIKSNRSINFYLIDKDSIRLFTYTIT